jgi:hypothetical protein
MFGRHPRFRQTWIEQKCSQEGRTMTRPTLTVSFCQTLVVNAAPIPGNFTGDIDIQLLQLGVIDATQTSAHQENIQSAMFDQGFQIKLSDIQSGPTVSVSACLFSVRDNAH